MTDEMFYSTGQAARELGITPGKARALCVSQCIDSVFTDGGQYRIARAVVERLKREGLPAIPRPLPDTDRPRAMLRSRSNRGEVSLLAEPSVTVIDSAETVACLEHEVRAVELRRKREEQLDWFRERDARAAAEQADRDEAERVRQAELEAERQREHWKAKWVEFGLSMVPREVPREYHLEVHRSIEEALQRLSPSHPDSITRPLVEAAVESALAPWRRQKQIADIIEQSCESFSVPSQMQRDSAWKVRMQAAAAEAISGLREGASASEMRTVAQNALVPLVLEYEALAVRVKIIESAWLKLLDGNRQDWAQGKEAVLVALARLPFTASRRELEQARDTALEPIRASIAARLDKEMRAKLAEPDVRFFLWPEKLRAEAPAAITEMLKRLPPGTPESELKQAKEVVIERFQGKIRLIERGVRQIRPYVEKLMRDWEFDETTEKVTRDLEAPLRAFLQEKLNGTEDEEQVALLVHRKVRTELDIR